MPVAREAASALPRSVVLAINLVLLCSWSAVPSARQALADANSSQVAQGSVGSALLIATPTDGTPQRWEALIDALLGDENLKLSSEHWQGSAKDLETTLGLLRSGRRRSNATGSPAEGAPAQPVSEWLTAANHALSALPKGVSFPLLRRGLTATVLQAWLSSGRQLSESDEAAAMQLLASLGEQHRAAAAKKTAVEFYHFSKAAGTSVCVTSAEAGCTTFSVTEQHTCLVPPFGDGPRWINRKAHTARCRRTMPENKRCLSEIYSKLAKWGNRYHSRALFLSCQDRAVFMERSGYNFYASEYTLRGRNGNVTAAPALCAEFLNLAVLRAPRARLRSHLRYIVRVTYERMAERTAKYFKGMTMYDWQKLVPAITDNFYVRSLLGEEGFYTNPGSLTAEAHLPAARAALGSMDLVMVLENSQQVSALSHKWGLGWNVSFLEASGRAAKRESPEVKKLADQFVPSGAAANSLAAANGLDQELYDYAVLLSRLDAAVWAAAEASAGRRQSRTAQQTQLRSLLQKPKNPARASKGEKRGPCGFVPAAAALPLLPPLSALLKSPLRTD